LKRVLSKYSFLLVVAAIIIFFDQLTKNWVRTNIPLGGSWSPWEWLEPYARFVHWTNTGAAFGMLQGFGDVFMVLAIIVALVIVWYFPQVPKEEWPLRFALGMQFAGAAGNLIDRVTQNGQVTDFISVGNFAVFNIADASISVGVAVLVLGVWIKEWQQRKDKPSGGEPEDKPDVSEQGQPEKSAPYTETENETRVDSRSDVPSPAAVPEEG
jgi:signal peptidase II